MQRREFLKTAALAAAALPAYGQAINKLTDRLSVITGAGNNIVALASDAGSFLVDSGDAAHAQDVLRLAGRVSIVINTHWHPESTGGNDVLGRAGAKILAQLNTQLWMTQDIVHEWEKKTYPARAKEAWPTETFVTAGKASFAGEPIEWALMPNAHTDGDTYVHFTGANVLAVGDAVQPGRFPTLDWLSTGWIGGMQEAQRAI
jgi:glyoxylase-like metal-dependent hydrolase (beta-lactamase superfamily II)